MIFNCEAIKTLILKLFCVILKKPVRKNDNYYFKEAFKNDY